MGNFSDEVLKSLSEKEGEVSERVIRNVRYLFKTSGSQADFCRFCKDKYNTKVNQGNLSKMLNQKTNRVTPLLVIMLSRYFGVDLEELLLKEFSPMEAILENVVGKAPEDPRLVLEATDYHFDNYINRDYHCYFYSTIARENKIIHGTFQLKRDSENNRCRVTMSINTGVQDERTGREYIKQYEGIMMISVSQSVCYCLVANEKIGELNVIMFRYVPLLNKKYKGGMATVSTISAGDSRLPTIHRMCICDHELSPKSLERLKYGMMLNAKTILIPRLELEALLNSNKISDKTQKRIVSTCEEVVYYKIEEGVLRTLPPKELGMSVAEFIALIRSKSYSLRYNKISPEVDKQLLSMMQEEK